MNEHTTKTILWEIEHTFADLIKKFKFYPEYITDAKYKIKVGEKHYVFEIKEIEDTKNVK
jgi:hypothetical protein